MTIIVFGSAGARMVPEGFPVTKGFEQYVDILRAQFRRQLLGRAEGSDDGHVGQPRDEAGDEQLAIERLVLDDGDAELGAPDCSMDR